MTIDLRPRVERSFGNPRMMQKPRNSARTNTVLEPRPISAPTTSSTSVRPTSSDAGLRIVNRRLGGRQIELHEPAAHLFHGNPFGLLRLRMAVVGGLVEARARAAAKLLGAQRGDIDE